jgi:hypothetical protein
LPEPIGGILEINQAIKTYPEQLNTTLKSIEILPTGVMRWHFEFWNKAADSVSVRTLPQSYVVDNLGNRYALTSGFDLAIQPGVRVEDKADFEAPKAGANAFTLYLLNGYIGSDFEEPALTVSAVLQPGAALEPTPGLDGVVVVDVNQAIKTYPEQLNTTLKSIEILPTGVMRWHFEFWNKAADSVSVRTLPQSYVVDNLGNRYALTSGFDLAIQPGVRVEDKADFEAPKAGANAFTLHLLNGYIGSGFEEPALTVSAVLNKSN